MCAVGLLPQRRWKWPVLAEHARAGGRGSALSLSVTICMGWRGGQERSVARCDMGSDHAAPKAVADSEMDQAEM
eukprot:3714653-Prymnesium_polylepis.1